jgi:hypothetical protein
LGIREGWKRGLRRGIPKGKAGQAFKGILSILMVIYLGFIPVIGL